MKNQVKRGDVMSILAPYAVVSGAGVKRGLLFGVAQADAANGAAVEIVTTGVFTLPKVSAQAWTVGAAIYWDDTAKNCTTATTAGNLFIGVAAAIAANPTATGVVRLNGSAPTAVTP
jgi:predicted RecA/RadA family phage recombinase